MRLLFPKIPITGKALRLALALLSCATLLACGAQPTSDDPTSSTPATGLSIADLSVTEGGTFNFIVTLASSSASDITFDYVTGTGTASTGDFAASSGSVTIGSGSLGTAIAIATIDDFDDEPNEQFGISLSNIAGVVANRSYAIGTIVDNDALPQIVIADTSLTEGQSAQFVISIIGNSAAAITVNYATSPGTAASADFVAQSGRLTFSPGQAVKTVFVATVNDVQYEINESFNLNLSAPSNASILDGVGVGTLSDNDPMPLASIYNTSINEGYILVFPVTLSAASSVSTSIQYAVISQTASNGQDFNATTGTLNIAAGSISGTIQIQSVNDTTFETNETLAVSLVSATNATIGAGIATGTIVNNDPVPQLRIYDQTISEGQSALFRVSLSNASYLPVVFDYLTQDLTAISGVDYVLGSGTLSFSPGQLGLTFAVATIEDTIAESAETFGVTLTNVSDATVADGWGVATISLSDPVPNIYATAASATEGSTLNFTVSLNFAASLPVYFDATAITGAATVSADFLPFSGSFSIPAGSLSAQVSVVSLEDSVDEANETFILSLSNITNSFNGQITANGTINDNDASPGIQITDASATEGQSAVLIISTTTLSGQPVSFHYATVNGTAIAGADYFIKSGNLTIPAGSQSVSIFISGLNDTIYEGNEIYYVSLSSILNATPLDAAGAVTIVDNDPQPTLNIQSVVVNEGATLQFCASITNMSTQPVTFNYITRDGTAQIGDNDYTAKSGVGTIAAGSLSMTIKVPTIQDLTAEANEILYISLSSLNQALAGSLVATGTINNNDIPTGLFAGDATDLEGSTLTFTVSLAAPLASSVTVEYQTHPGTASLGADFDDTSGTITILSGSLTAQFDVVSTDDALSEAAETFVVSLSNPTGTTIAQGLGLGTLTDNDSVPDIFIDSAVATEGFSAYIVVSLSDISGQEISADYDTFTGSADGSDFVLSSGRFTIAAGASATTFAIATVDDANFEASEDFLVSLSALTNANVGIDLGLVTINDDDALPSLNIDDVTDYEGSLFVFTISLTATQLSTVRVDYQTYASSATSGTDFIAKSGTATILPGALQTQVWVTVNDDSLAENWEVFSVSLSNPVNTTITDDVGLGSIDDNDPNPSIFISSASVTEGQTGFIIVSLSSFSGKEITADYSSYDGTADGSDYVGLAGQLTIPDNTLTTVIALDLLDDGIFEDNETFDLSLSSVSNASIGAEIASVTILDNETPPLLYIGDTSVNEGSTGTFNISISAISATDTVMTYATVNSTAVSGSDYNSNSGVLTIPAGSTTATLQVISLVDAFYETTETYLVTLSGLIGASAGDLSGQGTIINTNPDPNLTVTDSSVTEGGTFNFIVSISSLNALNTTFSYTTLAATALAGTDYTTVSGTGTIASGAQSVTILVSTVNDVLVESTETLSMSLSAVANASGLDLIGVGSIIDNDTVPNMYVSDATATEGGSLAFLVTISNPKATNVTFNYRNFNITATNPADYGGFTLVGTILPGALSFGITVPTIDDNLYEGTETMQVTLMTPVGATIIDPTGVGTITDNDSVPILSVNTPTVTESGTAVFTVSLSNPRSSAVTFSYSATNGTATLTGDYTASAGVGTILAGALTKAINVVTVNDTIHENSENFSLTITGAVGTSNAIAGGLATLLDDDDCTRLTLEAFRTGTAAATGYGAIALGSLTILTVGNDTSTVTRYTTRRSPNTGTTWALTDTYQLAAGKLSVAKGVAKDSLGNLFTVGNSQSATNINKYITRKSTDMGTTWATSDTFFSVSTKHALANGIAIDSTNKIYTVGRAIDATNVDQWIVRKSINSGTSWTTDDSYRLTITGAAYANAAATDASNNVYVVGAATDGTANHWIVRKFNGTTWTTVDNYQYVANVASEARSVAIDSAGTIYVAGFGTSGTVTSWIVRMSTNGGSTWSVVDTFNFVAGKNSQANGLITNASGHILVIGQGIDATNFNRWIVRRSINGGSTWLTVDTYQNTASKHSMANGLAIDANGEFIVTGSGANATSSQFVTRRMICY